MQTRFFSPSEIIRYFEQGELTRDLLGGESIAVCSIADLLDICEAHKKGTLRPTVNLHMMFKQLSDGPIREGLIFVSNLDQDALMAALFEREGGTILGLWSVAADRHISPRQSIRRLTLKITDMVWWSDSVYQEMEEYHTVRDV